ncbi:hypothetical protein ABE10_00995, partial [Bacillus toyonensis]|nr:hypothetical protein [Bacillus toyonensis]
LDRVAVLERERGVLAQERVVHEEAALVLGEVRERQPLLPVRAVMEHRVTLHEGATSRVLPRETHGSALDEEGAEGEQLAESPVDAALSAHLDPFVQLLLELRMHREALGLVGVGVTDEVDDVLRDAGHLRLAVLRLHRCELGCDRGRARLRGVRLGEGDLQAVLEVGLGLVVLLLGDVAAPHEGLGVEAAHRALRLDQVGHQRLGHRRVVALVVAAAAVADEVDDDVTVEALAVLEGELRDVDHRLGVVAVDVQDRRLDGLG